MARPARPWVQTTTARHPKTPTPLEAVPRYEKLVHRLAWRCSHTLPTSTTYSHDDLVQEGMVVLVYSLARYKPRRAAFSTYLHISLRNRYSEIWKREWARADTRVDPMLQLESGHLNPHTEVSDSYALHYHVEDDYRLAVLPGQEVVELALDWERGRSLPPGHVGDARFLVLA